MATGPWVNALSQSGLLVPLRWKHGVPFLGEYEEYFANMAVLAQIGVGFFFTCLIFQLARPKLK